MFLCFLAALCEGYDVQAAGVAAAGLKDELHPAAEALSVFFSASGAGLMIGALIGGRLSDRVGRKAVLIASISAFGVFSLATAIAPNMYWLTGTRFLTGLGLGGAMPNLIALAADSSAERRRNSSIAAAYIGMPLGGVFASLTVYLLPVQAWRTVFQIGGLAPLLIVPLMLGYLPSPSAGRGAQGAGAAHMLRTLFAKPRAVTTGLLWLGFFLIVLTLHLMLNWLPLLLVGRGLLQSQASLAQAGFNVGGALIAASLGVLLDSRWRSGAIAVSLISLPIIILLMAVAGRQPTVMIGLASLLGGAILAQQVIVYAVASVCYAAARGTGMGAAVAAGRLGSLAGPLFAGALLAAGRSPSQVLLGVLPIVLVCGACVALLAWREFAASGAMSRRNRHIAT